MGFLLGLGGGSTAQHGGPGTRREGYPPDGSRGGCRDPTHARPENRRTPWLSPSHASERAPAAKKQSAVRWEAQRDREHPCPPPPTPPPPPPPPPPSPPRASTSARWRGGPPCPPRWPPRRRSRSSWRAGRSRPS